MVDYMVGGSRRDHEDSKRCPCGDEQKIDNASSLGLPSIGIGVGERYCYTRASYIKKRNSLPRQRNQQ